MAKVVHLQVDQAATFSKQFTARDKNGNVIDLTDYTVSSTIKKMFLTYAGIRFTTTIDDAANGKFTLSLTDEETAGLAADTFVYDVQLEDSKEVVTRIIEGKVNVIPSVTSSNPYVAVGGMSLTDPSVVHVHSNKDVLDKLVSVSQVPSPWKPIDVDYPVENGDRLMVDTAANGQILLTVPDAPEEFDFYLRVMDLRENFGVATVVVQNESGTVIYEETTTGADFELLYTDSTSGYKIIQ